MPAGLAIFTMILCCLLAHEAVGQKEWKDRYVTSAKGNQTLQSVARPSQATYTIVVWEDLRNATSGPDIYIQKIDNLTGLPLWNEPDGLAVCVEPGAQRNPVAAYDSLGGVIVAWEDERNGSGGVYAMRIVIATGYPDPAWPGGGVSVCDVQSSCAHVRVAGTADGAFITWLDTRIAGVGGNRLVYAQYLLSSTSNWPSGPGMQWVQNGIPVAVAPGSDQTNPEIARDLMWHPDGNQDIKCGCVIAYQNRVSFGGTAFWNVQLTNLDANGIPGYGGTDVVLAPMPSDQLHPQVACTGMDATADRPRAIVVWQDSRENPNLPRFDIIAQVVDANGVTGNPGGEVICDVPGTQRTPVLTVWERPYDAISGDEYSPYGIIAWEDLRDSLLSDVDIYSGKFDARFLAIMSPNGTDGEVISQAPLKQDEVAIDLIPSTSTAHVAWRHANASPDATDIHYQEIDVRAWQYGKPIGGWPVTEAKGDQERPAVSASVFVWEDARRTALANDFRTDRDIYCQTPGDCVGPTAMDWRDVFADVRIDATAAHLRFTTDSDFNTYVVWQKVGQDPAYQDVYIQKVDASGVPRWSGGGIKLNTMDRAQHPEVAISDIAGGAQAVWQQLNTVTGLEEMWYAKIDPTGSFALGPLLLKSDPAFDITHPMIVFTDSIVDFSDPFGSPAKASEYSAYFGWTRSGDLYFGARLSGALTTDDRNATWVHGGGWEEFVKLVSPPGRHLYAVGIGADPGGGSRYCILTCRFVAANSLGDDFGLKPFSALVDFGGIDIALDRRTIDGSQDAIVVVAMSNYPHRGAWLYAHWASARIRDLTVPADVLIGVPVGLSRFSHPRLAPDEFRSVNEYGGMLLAWDYEFPVASAQRHIVVSDKITYPFGQNYPPISRCQPFANPVLVSTQQYPWPTNPEIARIDAANGVDTLAFIVWEGLTENCMPSRTREIVGQWVAYNYFPGPQRGPQWTVEKQIAPGAGHYMQTIPLVQTSDASTVQVYWLDGRAGTDLVAGTRVEGLSNNAIQWMKDTVNSSTAVPTRYGLEEVWPNPLESRTASVSHVLVVLDEERAVTLDLRDMLGRVVGVVHRGVLPAGRNVLRFDASGLPPGRYFYALRGMDRIFTRGMVLVR